MSPPVCGVFHLWHRVFLLVLGTTGMDVFPYLEAPTIRPMDSPAAPARPPAPVGQRSADSVCCALARSGRLQSRG